ncbi:MAG: hypothetical protein MJZ75_03520 [Paludibacteraceae bacterium]|nr:hypothetical protein [Paludibacteraceae bacterium]
MKHYPLELTNRGKRGVEGGTFEITYKMQQLLRTDKEAAFEYMAELKTMQRVLDAAIKRMDDRLIEEWLEVNEVGKSVQIGEDVFAVIDKPEYNYEGNDDDGLYRLKVQAIESLEREKKVLTKERNVIQDRIRLEHPNMQAEHHYIFVYKGTAADVNGWQQSDEQDD